MIPYQNYEIYVSITLFIVTKIVCATFKTRRVSMYDKKDILTSIPEKNESNDDIVKWVPKKKHEVLKAKYKCLKKLFQIYDASVIGILPQNYPEDSGEPERSHRRKRTHRTKTDACAGTTDISSGDISLSQSEETAAPAAIEDLTLHQYSSTGSTNTVTLSKIDKVDKSTQDFKDASNSDKRSECVQASCPVHEPRANPYLLFHERRRPTRFQSFFNRIFGLKPERRYSFSPTGHVYAASDNNISNRYEKRRKRGLRFRRRRPKRIHSEVALRDIKSPIILSYVQSVQRDCLMDTTPRQCPFQGCSMVFCGIINYNDHLNLCHFTDRKYICHYCHEGFAMEYDKTVHENEHIGVTKMHATLPLSPLRARSSVRIASNTQTEPDHKIDVSEQKLKKIVSFFDKMSHPEQVIDQFKRNNFSAANTESLEQSYRTDATDTEKSQSMDSEKRVSSCVNLKKSGRKCASSDDSDTTSSYPCDHRITCHFCGENFNYRRQLSLHVDLEHRVHDKFSKFHSCPGIVHRDIPDVVLEDGRINIQSIDAVTSQSAYSEVSRRKSDHSVTCDPSTNIVYYASVDSISKKPSVVGSLVKKIRSYKWEPGTNIIHV